MNSPPHHPQKRPGSVSPEKSDRQSFLLKSGRFSSPSFKRKTCTPESRGGDKDGIGNLKTAHAAARFAAAVPRSIFHQGQDSGRLNRRAPRGLQRVGFLAKWPKSGVLGRFAGVDRGRTILLTPTK